MKRYQEVTRTIHNWIEAGVLKVGDRVPSVREMSRTTGFSAVTVHHAYALLESDGILRARPRSGFFVAGSALAGFSAAKGRVASAASTRTETLSLPDRLLQIMLSWHDRERDGFGSLFPSSDLFPSRELDIELTRGVREVVRGCLAIPPKGNRELREVVARRAAQRGITVHSDNIAIVPSAERAFEACLDAVTKAGDLVMMESPAYFPYFSTLRRRQLRVVEVHSHPRTGIDPDQFAYLLDHSDVRACVLSPVLHYPTGVTYPADSMRRIMDKALGKGTIIIEDDQFGTLVDDGVLTFKRLDPGSSVLQFGGWANVLGPKFGLGWVLDRRAKVEVIKDGVFRDQTYDAIRQSALARYLARRSYDRHLRRLREQMAERMRRGRFLLSGRLPSTCAVSSPAGGFTCWIRGPADFDSVAATEQAAKSGISLSPGPLFSVAASFRNFIGMNMSVRWDDRRERQLDAVAALLAAGRPAIAR